MIKLLLFLISGDIPTSTKYVDYCTLSMEKLSHKARVEMGIGCSTVNEKRLYSDYKLKRIYTNE